MRIYTIQKLAIHLRKGMVSYFEIVNTLDTIKIINNNYDELVNKYKYLHPINYTKTGIIIDDSFVLDSNPRDYFINGIYKTEEDDNDYYLISFIDIY
jgi:hypothetical protein